MDELVYFASRQQMNDPFDCAPAISASSTPAQKKAKVKSLAKSFVHGNRALRRAQSANVMREAKSEGWEERLRGAYDSVADPVGVLSLSEESGSVMMWSHYADAHRGICLQITTTDAPFPMPVRYSDTRPVVNMIKMEAGNLLENSLLTKAAGWAYEREWRAIRREGIGLTRLPKGAVTGVLLGARISQTDKAEVLQWVKEARRAITVEQCRICDRAFQILIEPLR